MMKYVKTENIKDADFWIPLYDERFIGIYYTRKIATTYRKVMKKLFKKEFNSDNFFTYEKPYKLMFNEKSEEYYVVDNRDGKNFLWNIHRGYFVKSEDV